MDIRLTCQRSTGFAILPVVVVVGQVILQRIIGRADKVGLMVADVVTVRVGEILTALEVAGTVAARLVALSGVGDEGSIEGTVVYPAALNGCGESVTLLLSLHTDTVLGNVHKRDVSHLKALAEAVLVVSGLTDEVQTPAVHYSVTADTLDGDILTAGHSRHCAVVTDTSAVIDRVVCCEAVGRGDVTYNTDNKGRAVLSELADDVRVSVGDTALSIYTAANVLANGVEYITDTDNGCAILRGD